MLCEIVVSEMVSILIKVKDLIHLFIYSSPSVRIFSYELWLMSCRTEGKRLWGKL